MTPAEWAPISEAAHSAGFGKYKDPAKERIDFVLVAEHDEKPAAYVTCKELDADSLYFQFGASVGEFRHSPTSWDAFCGFMNYAQENYQRLSMLIENDNIAMLKFAWKAGLKCTGVRYFKKNILLEHSIEF